MHKTLTILILLILSCQKSEAQIDSLRIKRNNISIKLGYDNTLFKDLNFSPLNYSSNSFGVQVGYVREFKKGNELFTNAGFSNGTLQSKASDYFNSDRYLINFKLGYLQKITSKENKFQVKVGLQYHSFLNMVFYDGTEAFTYYGLHSSDIIGKLHYQLNVRHSLNTTLEIPIFGLLVRPPYSGINKFQQENSDFKIATTGKLTSLNDFFALKWTLDYKYLLDDNRYLLVSYSFGRNSTNYLHKAIIIENQILIGIQFEF